MEHKEYIILGAGIGGLSTAIALAKIGVEATVLEAAPEFHPTGAGITLAANAMEIMDRLGLAEVLKNKGRCLESATVADGHGRLISRIRIKDLGLKHPLLGIHRGDLHEVLIDALEPEQLRWGYKLKTSEVLDDRVVLHFESGEALSCNYLIAADGIGSLVRKNLNPTAVPQYAGYTCWRGVCRMQANDEAEAVEIWGNKGRFGYVPVDDNRMYWFATANAPGKDPEMGSLGVDGLVRRFADYPEIVIRLIRNTAADQVLWNDILDLQPNLQSAYGRVLLLGDAAHATTPNMGQGACMAIEDAWYLAAFMERESNPEKAFETFSEFRRPRTALIIQRSRKLGALAQRERGLIAGLRNALFRGIPEHMALKTMRKTLALPPMPA